ncbi:uncharacterized protein LOC109525302 isoform X3 [Hippocampus comes]|uniref:uncharacterized protein LOC109525302 isoform X3 n=1 Tax=Hippocampus comes TaxID=109280 RepID=UPI00094EB464|nr:PREDICTED: uncharacterized protein LOC109525302 isoform X3 [Hippocampus comes]
MASRDQLYRGTEENEQQQDAILLAHMKGEDVQQVMARHEQLPPHMQKQSSCLEHPQSPHVKEEEEEEPQPAHVKEEEEEVDVSQLPLTVFVVKIEDDGDDDAQLHHHSPGGEQCGGAPPELRGGWIQILPLDVQQSQVIVTSMLLSSI